MSKTKHYEVGYRKPPKEHRFKKGQSGNPRGKPPGAKNKSRGLPLALDPVKALLMKEFGEPMGVIIDGERVELPALEVAVRRLKAEAVKGDFPSLKLLLQLARETSAAEAADKQERIAMADWYQKRWGPIFAAAAERGAPEPSQLPHPDHIVVSHEILDVLVNGPEDKAAKEYWDLVKGVLRLFEDDSRLVEARLLKEPDSEHLRNKLEFLKQLMTETEREKVPRGWNWHECVTDFDRAYYRQRESWRVSRGQP